MYPEEEGKAEEVPEQPVEDENDLDMKRRAKAIGFMLTLILRARFKKMQRGARLIQKSMKGYAAWKEKNWELKEIKRERDDGYVEKQIQWLSLNDRKTTNEKALKIQRMYHNKIQIKNQAK